MKNNLPNKIKIYDSDKRGLPAIEELKVLFRYRDLILQLIRRDLVSRYKRSALGVAWTMLNPLGTMLVMTIVFSQVFGRVPDYPVYVLSGLVIWNLFSQSTNHSMASTLWGSGLFQKIFLPKTAFIVSSIGTGIVNLTLSLVPLLLIMLITNVKIHLSIIILPLAILFTAAFSLGIGLFLSTYCVVFPDIAEMYPIVLTAWMYMSPIIVPEDTLAKIANGLLLKANPMYYMVKIFRSAIYNGQFPDLSTCISAGIISFAMLIIGWYIFTKNSDKLVYYV